MTKIEILSQKQKNGLWGMPMSCVEIDTIPRNIDHLLWSAIVIAIAQTYPDETFKIMLSSETGFLVELSKQGLKGIRFNEYEVQDNILIYKD